MSYAYWNRLRTNLSLQQPTGVWTNQLRYDAARRLTNLTSQAGSFAYTYDVSAGAASGLIRRLVLPNAAYITNDFDASGRLLFTRLLTSAGWTSVSGFPAPVRRRQCPGASCCAAARRAIWWPTGRQRREPAERSH